MSDLCDCTLEAGCNTCELPSQSIQRTPRTVSNCPECGKNGKPVEGQTVKAMLSVTLREIKNTEYLFCKTETCPIVYFSVNGLQTFSTSQVREKVFQKEPVNKDVKVCYCFQHTVGTIQNATADEHKIIIENINTGIKVNQCACDLRNPQGSCCLGNVRSLIKLSAIHS
jgi:hypothetical protein